MAVLKAPPKQPKTTVVQLRLDDEAKTKLTKYAEFLDCSPFVRRDGGLETCL
jgi:hypothetical protein